MYMCVWCDVHVSIAVGKAYSILSDSSRRNQYDRFGEDGLQSHGVAPEPDFSPDDVFRMFFGDNFAFGADDSELLCVEGNTRQ